MTLFGNILISYTTAHKTVKNTYTVPKMGAVSFCQLSALSFTVVFVNLYCIFCKEIKQKGYQDLMPKLSRIFQVLPNTILI